MKYLALAAGVFLAPGAAHAEDKDSCPAGLICASNPDTVADALRQAGYQAKIGTDGQGDPSISSSAAGYNYTVFFYGCVEHRNCDSIQFQVSFTKDPGHTADLANKWNTSKRFLQAAANPDGTLQLDYDISTVGGLTQKNFADTVDWWQVLLGKLPGFFSENLPKGK